MKSILYFILLLAFLTCCDNFQHKDSAISERLIIFHKFYRKFKPISLPLVLKACDIPEETFISITAQTDSPFAESPALAYRSLKLKENFCATISLIAADCSLPVLTTYDNNGEQIDQKEIAIGNWGGGPGISCSEYMIIRNDLSIYVSDTMSVTKVNNVGKEIKGTTQNFVEYREGKLHHNGKIELSEIKKIVLE